MTETIAIRTERLSKTFGRGEKAVEAGHPLGPPLPGFTAEPALAVSLIALALRIVVPVALSIILFNRQDITS